MQTPFLTDLDVRAAIKGSRDPLGLQPIWTRLGRHLVGNLTTGSTSARDFTTLLLGYYFAERVASEGSREGDLSIFLKWEQLAAYARAFVNKDYDFRGTERVRTRLSDGSRIHLGVDAQAQILGNQKIYGLWGLYSVPGRASGLLGGEPVRLTPPARDLVEGVYVPLLTKHGFRKADPIVELLGRSGPAIDVGGREAGLVKAVAQVLGKRFLAEERRLFKDHLLEGGPGEKTGGLQAILVRALEGTFADTKWSLSAPHIRQLADLCRKHGPLGEKAAERLEGVATCEALLAPSAALFEFLLASDGQTPDEIVREVRSSWGGRLGIVAPEALRALEPEIRAATGDADSPARWLAVADALAAGDYAQAIQRLLAINRAVMQVRSGAAPWAGLREGRLDVRFRDDKSGRLPEKKELPVYWRHSYFLDSLRTVALELRG